MFDLFSDQQAPQTASAPTPRAQMIAAFKREAAYQKLKTQGDQMQNQWKKQIPKIKADQDERRAANLRFQAQPPGTYALVACVSKKLSASSPAADLYISDWFKKARKYAEANSAQWFVLSALHGLVEPSEIIEPYNETLSGKRLEIRRAWASRTASSILSTIPPQSRIIVLAGEAYRSELLPLISDKYSISVPMVGLGIGEQLQFMKKALEGEQTK